MLPFSLGYLTAIILPFSTDFLSYCCPQHGSSNAMSRSRRASYPMKLRVPGHDKRDTCTLHKPMSLPNFNLTSLLSGKQWDVQSTILGPGVSYLNSKIDFVSQKAKIPIKRRHTSFLPRTVFIH
jgi:hypothetical protein